VKSAWFATPFDALSYLVVRLRQTSETWPGVGATPKNARPNWRIRARQILCKNRSVCIDRLGALARSLSASMCEGTAPLARLAHKRAATSVRTAGACASYLLAFGAHRDCILLHMRRRRRFMPVRMLGLVQHMPRPLGFGKPNRDGKCEQRHKEGLQLRFCVHVGVVLAQTARCVRASEGGKIDPASTIFTSFCAGWG
jgi:hypothetical protein